jgi:hypothetical protein
MPIDDLRTIKKKRLRQRENCSSEATSKRIRKKINLYFWYYYVRGNNYNYYYR